MSEMGEIYVVTASGAGHLFPCIQLCNYLSSINYTTTLVHPSSAVSPSHSHLRSIQITSPARGQPADAQMGSELQAHLSARPQSVHSTPSVAIVDFQMDWTNHIFWNFKIPVVTLFTFGACAAAMEWGAWKSRAAPAELKPGESLLVPGLPHEMTITHHDAARSRPRAAARGPPEPGDRPPWALLVERSAALMFNTCDDLERPFIDYMANQIGVPAWGVGPLLPHQFWDLSKSNDQIRQPANQSNYSHEFDHQQSMLQWLDEKQEKSVVYVAFGSEVSPTKEEIMQLAAALEEIDHPFIWAVKNQESESFNLDDLGMKVGERGFIIRGWAPQLIILSHPSTGGYLSHCGWNSTLEAIGCGVPIMAWPIRGDQFYNAKLVVNHLKIGYMRSPEMAKGDLISGVKKLMMDEGARRRVEILGEKFKSGFPSSSKVALETFIDVVIQSQISN